MSRKRKVIPPASKVRRDRPIKGVHSRIDDERGWHLYPRATRHLMRVGR